VGVVEPTVLRPHEIGMAPLFEVSLGDPAVRVAVLDSGIDIAHADLAAAIVDPYDAFDDDDDPSPNPGEFCNGPGDGICDEHGTAVSGIIAARADNGEGIVGLCAACTLVPIKLLGDGGGALSGDIAAFEHAIEADAAVINNSWGFIDPTTVPVPLADVIHRAATEPRGGLGAVVIFAAGNDDRELGNDEMEALPDVLCVGATDIYGAPTAYTNTGDALDVAAPSATYSTAPGGYTDSFGGTSAAAPVVSGLAAWIVSVAPELSSAEVRAVIVETAVKSPLVTFDEAGHHPIYGYGNLAPGAILERLFPTDTGDEDGPKACGCSQTSGSSAWPLFALGALLLRRQRAGTVIRTCGPAPAISNTSPIASHPSRS
jgi:serine protease